MINLVSASSTSWNITGLWVGGTLLSLGLLGKHKSVGNISTLWVLVEGFTRVDSGGIRGVSSEGLERVEVHGGTRGSWVPLSVDNLLGIVIPKFVIVFTVLDVKVGGNTSCERGRGEGTGTGEKSGKGNNFELFQCEEMNGKLR
jgi:hypothetical protein